MARNRFSKPTLIPTLFIVVATLLMVSLGAWQLHRLSVKEQLLSDITSAETLPAVASVPADAGEAERLQYRKGVFTGHYLPGKMLNLVGQKSSGYVRLVPLQLEDSDEVILVSLGWFAEKAEVNIPQGTAVATGVLRKPFPLRTFSPENDPERNLWFWEDMPLIEQTLGVKLAPLVLDTGMVARPRNDHLGYAITWFVLAGVGLVMFALYHRKKL